jgi:hypothetical protein
MEQETTKGRCYLYNETGKRVLKQLMPLLKNTHARRLTVVTVCSEIQQFSMDDYKRLQALN